MKSGQTRCHIWVSLSSNLILLLCLFISTAIAEDPKAAKAPKSVDEARAERFADHLKGLVKNRDALRQHCESIVKQDYTLERAVWQEWSQAVTAYQAAAMTPQFQLAPRFGVLSQQTRFVLAEGNNNANGNQVWYAIQDNSMLKQAWANQSFLRQVEANLDAATLANHRIALFDISNQVDRNFEEFRSQVDWMGRRSKNEHDAALQVTREARIKDPRGAGISLIQAAAYRSLGNFGDCIDRMDEIDDFFPKLQVLHLTFKMQLEFLNDNNDELKKVLPEATYIGNEYQLVEPLLIRGWIGVAQKNWPMAHDSASDIKRIAPEWLEGAILSAWITMSTEPKKGKDAVSSLRGAAIRKSTDDWYFDEAIAQAFAMSGNWEQAKSHMGLALRVAPDFVRDDLQKELDQFARKQLPTIDWNVRLRGAWTLQ